MIATQYGWVQALAAASVLTMIALGASGCTEDKPSDTDGADCPNPGRSINVEGEPYCVFIEEGFLADQCPPDFPNGQEIDEVVVCSQREEIPEEAVRTELEKQGLLGGSSCEQDSDCPQPDDSPFCDGTTAVSPPPASGVCVEGACGIASATREEIRTDCAASDQVCADGACVPDDGPECSEECPHSAPVRLCEDNVAVEISGLGFCNDEGVCEIRSESTRIDCADSGQVCSSGQCIDGGPECTMDEQCPRPSAYFACEGTVAVQIVAFGFCDDTGVCQIDGDETRTDCADQGQICQDSDCVDASDIEVESGWPLDPPEQHRACDTVEDCAAVYIGCGACEGDCQGVNTSLEETYTAALSCEGYDGPECDFDCHPRSGLTELVCEEGLCKINVL